MLISSKDMNDLQRLKKLLKIEFEMKDLGITKKIIRMDIKRDRAKGILTLSQFGYVKKILKQYQMLDAKFVNIPMGAYFKLRFILHDLSPTKFEFMKNFPYSNCSGQFDVCYDRIQT